MIGCLTLVLRSSKVVFTNREANLWKVWHEALWNCLKGTDNCFGCGKSGKKVTDFPNVRGQDKVSAQTQASGSHDALKKNRFYVLRL